MLQQTQVATVLGYYERFLQRFPDVLALASASIDDVFALWSGLGYYSRARNLHRCAQVVTTEHGGHFPRTSAELMELPGIGRSTAAAIAAFCFDERVAIFDGNVKRVLARLVAFEGDLGEAQAHRELWDCATELLPATDVGRYTQGLMDLGATVCKRVPDCGTCPVKVRCVARKTGRIAELPAPRAKKPLPLKRANWFVFVHAGKVLLERRPAPGIWGGLWCFPERRPSSCRVIRKLPVIEHGFTHFRLRIQPLLCRGAPKGLGLRIHLGEATRAAIPTPVRNLLHDLRRMVTSRGGTRR